MTKKKILIIIILGFLIYSNTLKAPFVFDDERSVYKNPITLDFDKAISNFSVINFRYISQLSFALNYQIAGEFTFLYHVVNLSIHMLASVAVWRLALLIFSTPKIKKLKISKHKESISFLASLIFLTHPLQTQAVSYITQRYASMAALFYFSSAFFYLKARIIQAKKTKQDFFTNLFIAFFMALLAIYSKEISVSLPLMILSLEILCFNHKNLLKKSALFFPLFASFIAIIVWARGIENVFYTIISPLGEEITSYNYFLTESRVILKYVQLVFWPLRQSADYYFPISESLTDPRFLISASIILVILITSFLKRKKYPLLSVAVFWFFIALSVESSILPIDDVIFEHRLYLPMFGFALFSSAGLYYLFNYLKKEKLYKNIIYLLVFIYCILTFSRNFVWTNEVKFWADVVKKSPKKAKGYGALGVAYDKTNNPTKAIEYYEKSLELNPGLFDLRLKLHNNLGFSKSKLGRYDEAVEHYNIVLQTSPNFVQTRINIAQIYSQNLQYDEAAKHLEAAAKIQPGSFLIIHNLGISYLKMEDYEKAEKTLLKALKINPNSPPTKAALQKIKNIYSP